jgi:transposase InsO family protein
MGVRVERDLTDNGTNDKRQFDAAAERLGVRHKRTRPRRPQTNGKDERPIKTLVHEWAYARLYTTNRGRADALPVFVDFYNRHRPHTALGGQSPLDAVNNVSGDHS